MMTIRIDWLVVHTYVKIPATRRATVKHAAGSATMLGVTLKNIAGGERLDDLIQRDVLLGHSLGGVPGDAKAACGKPDP